MLDLFLYALGISTYGAISWRTIKNALSVIETLMIGDSKTETA